MTLEENIKAILECNFDIAKEEVIEAATKRIMEQIERQNPFEDEIELVINITRKRYAEIVKEFFNNENSNDILYAIANGKPLPKGHGDLIDRDEFHQTLENILIRDNDKWFNWLQKACLRLAEAPTIIEAESEEKSK